MATHANPPRNQSTLEARKKSSDEQRQGTEQLKKQQPTHDPKLTDREKTPGSGMFPDEKDNDAPSG